MTMEKINKDFLIEQGFIDTGEKHGHNIIWRKPIDDNRFFQFIMGDYPSTNPNVGILGIYSPEEEVFSTPKDLVGKDEWTLEDEIRAFNHTIKVEKSLINFAFWLDDQERFKRLIDDITFKRG